MAQAEESCGKSYESETSKVVAFTKQFVSTAPEWRNWHTQQTQNSGSAFFVLFKTFRNFLNQQKKTASIRSSNLQEF